MGGLALEQDDEDSLDAEELEALLVGKPRTMCNGCPDGYSCPGDGSLSLIPPPARSSGGAAGGGVAIIGAAAAVVVIIVVVVLVMQRNKKARGRSTGAAGAGSLELPAWLGPR